MKREREWPWRSVLKNEEKSIAGGNHGVGRAWNPEKVKSSGLPVRLKRVIGDEKKENLLGFSCQRCLPHSEELALDVLAGCGHGIGSQ